MRSTTSALSVLGWLNPGNWTAIAAADEALTPPPSLPPVIGKPLAEFGAELQASLEQAYFGPSLEGLPAGHLPPAFEADHRSLPGAGDVLQIVSGQTVLAGVRGPQHGQLAADASAQEAVAGDDAPRRLSGTQSTTQPWRGTAAGRGIPAYCAERERALHNHDMAPAGSGAYASGLDASSAYSASATSVPTFAHGAGSVDAHHVHPASDGVDQHSQHSASTVLEFAVADDVQVRCLLYEVHKGARSIGELRLLACFEFTCIHLRWAGPHLPQPLSHDLNVCFVCS
jgi:hypothetical protein